jgi:hypothetical protein
MDRFTLAVGGGVLALIVAALAVAMLVRSSATPPDLTTPSGTALAYALAVRRGEQQAAWDLLAPSEQARLDRERFLARASDSSAQNVYLTTDDERIDPDGGASVVLVRTFPRSGGLFSTGDSFSTRTTVRLIRVDGDWRISVPPDQYSLSLAEDKRP